MYRCIRKALLDTAVTCKKIVKDINSIQADEEVNNNLHQCADEWISVSKNLAEAVKDTAKNVANNLADKSSGLRKDIKDIWNEADTIVNTTNEHNSNTDKEDEQFDREEENFIVDDDDEDL